MSKDVADLLRQRNITNIPKDQHVLLEKEDSWAVNLEDTTHVLANVPGHVLQSVKDAYIRRKARSEKQKQPFNSPSPHVSASNHSEQDENARTSTPTGPSTVPSSSPVRQIPWSPSPARSQLRRAPLAESPIVRETPKIRPKVPLKVPIDVPPMAPPPRPAPQPRPAPSFDFVSSCGEEEDLEMELPQAQARRDMPVNRVASRVLTSSAHREITSTATTTINTPPCAQPDGPVIPGTLQESGKPVSVTQSEVPRRRRMKPIVFSDESPVKPSTAVTRMPTTKTFTETESWNSTSSSSIIPATHHDCSTQSSNPVSYAATPTYPASSPADTSEMIRTYYPDKAPYEEWARPSEPQASMIQRQQQQQQQQQKHHQQQQQIPQVATVTTNGHMSPYTAFITTYPDYVTGHAGSQWYFVKACVCLHILQKERQLREYLYDDFIRAFSGGFVKYVRSAGPGQEPLPAIEWFNMLNGPILFNRMCVTKTSLEQILSSYPEEVARARAIIKTGDETKKQPSKEPPARVGMDGAMDLDNAAEERPSQQVQVSAKSWTSEARSPPGPSAKLQMLPPPPPPPPLRQPSPELGSESVAPPPPPQSSALLIPTSTSKAPRSSPYLGRLASSSRSVPGSRKRSAEEQERLREHFRKRRPNFSRDVISSSRAE